jgi:hypothetical protein
MNSPVIRPFLLSILCSFTFLNSISGLWNQSTSLWNPGIVAEQMKEKFENMYKGLADRPTEEETQMVEQMFSSIITHTTPENITKIAIIMIIFESMTMFSAFLMWNLDRRGFYLYLAAIGFCAFSSLFVVGGFLGLVIGVGGVFSSCFMAILYALQLKKFPPLAPNA